MDFNFAGVTTYWAKLIRRLSKSPPSDTMIPSDVDADDFLGADDDDDVVVWLVGVVVGELFLSVVLVDG